MRSRGRTYNAAISPAYVEVITEFYKKHPEYRGIPFVDLMRLLNDRDRRTADQLYQMAQKGELRPVR